MKVVETSQQTTATQAIDPRVVQCREFVEAILGMHGCSKADITEFVEQHGRDLMGVVNALKVLSDEAVQTSGPYGKTFQIDNVAQRRHFGIAVKEVVQNAKDIHDFSAFLHKSSAALEALLVILEGKCGGEKPVTAPRPPAAPLAALQKPSISSTITNDQAAPLSPLTKRALGITERLGIPRNIAEYFIFSPPRDCDFGYSPKGVEYHNQAQVLAAAVSQLHNIGLSDTNMFTLLTRYPELVAHNLRPGEPGQDLWALANPIQSYLSTIENFEDRNNQPTLSAKQLAEINVVICDTRRQPPGRLTGQR